METSHVKTLLFAVSLWFFMVPSCWFSRPYVFLYMTKFILSIKIILLLKCRVFHVSAPEERSLPWFHAASRETNFQLFEHTTLKSLRSSYRGFCGTFRHRVGKTAIRFFVATNYLVPRIKGSEMTRYKLHWEICRVTGRFRSIPFGIEGLSDCRENVCRISSVAPLWFTRLPWPQ